MAEIIEKCKKTDVWQKSYILSEYQDPKWKPPLYNVWKLQDKTNKTSHFGNSEASFTDVEPTGAGMPHPALNLAQGHQG